MRHLIIGLALVATGCAGLTAKAGPMLATAQSAAVSARETLLPVVDGLCTSAAQMCRETQDSECEILARCQNIRRKIIKSIIAIHYAVLDANTALAIGDEEATWLAIDKALELIRQLRVQMKELGIGA